MITIKEYQEKTKETAIYNQSSIESSLNYLMPAIASEVGEVNGHWAKYLRDNGDFETVKSLIFKELGDIAWDIAEICNALDFSMEEVLEANIAKLKSRKDRGVLTGSGDNR